MGKRKLLDLSTNKMLFAVKGSDSIYVKKKSKRMQNYSLLIARAEKILAPDWLITTFRHLVGFFILCRNNNDFFQLLWRFDFLSRIVSAKNT